MMMMMLMIVDRNVAINLNSLIQSGVPCTFAEVSFLSESVSRRTSLE